jgi:LPS-assembly protein
MSLDPLGRVSLREVAFTTCPRNDTAWQIQARELELDTHARNGVGRGARVEFKGVPILYTPWISFPLGSERKSGFLFPSLGYSSRSGAQASVPYYWNIAPNLDLTAEPMLYSRRGVDLAGEFRYLTRRDRGKLAVNFLPNDRLFDDDRSYLRLDHVTNLPAGWRARIDAANVSDIKYFEDFGQGPEGTSTIFLERLLELSYRDEHWRLKGSLQDFQTLDPNLADVERPYSTVPRLRADGDFTLGNVLRYGFDSEAVAFDRNTGVTGWRFDVLPHIGLAWEGPGYFVRPGVTWRWTQYELDDTAPGADDSPSRTLPTASFDAGLIFEGPSGSHGQRRVTLEPRLLYVYTPYRNQDDLPIFDTAVPDLNLVQLFRTNRYVGADRVSDANQASLGITSRLFDTKDGRQYLAITLGQTYYFEDPHVRLPSEPVRDRSTSDFVAQLALTAFQNWSADFGVQWNPDTSERERMQARLQYRPGNESVVNVGYRFQRDRLDQAEASAAWPVGKNWSLYGSYVYSLEDDESIDQFAGLEYRSCCWRLKVLGRRFVSSQTGERDTGIYVQLELSGLASVGSSATAFLERAIRGYSPAITTP